MRVIPQEMFGTPFKVTRPSGEIVPTELALVPKRTTSTDSDIPVTFAPRRARRRSHVVASGNLEDRDFDGKFSGESS